MLNFFRMGFWKGKKVLGRSWGFCWRIWWIFFLRHLLGAVWECEWDIEVSFFWLWLSGEEWNGSYDMFVYGFFGRQQQQNIKMGTYGRSWKWWRFVIWMKVFIFWTVDVTNDFPLFLLVFFSSPSEPICAGMALLLYTHVFLFLFLFSVSNKQQIYRNSHLDR